MKPFQKPTNARKGEGKNRKSRRAGKSQKKKRRPARGKKKSWQASPNAARMEYNQQRKSGEKAYGTVYRGKKKGPRTGTANRKKSFLDDPKALNACKNGKDENRSRGRAGRMEKKWRKVSGEQQRGSRREEKVFAKIRLKLKQGNKKS